MNISFNVYEVEILHFDVNEGEEVHATCNVFATNYAIAERKVRKVIGDNLVKIESIVQTENIGVK